LKRAARITVARAEKALESNPRDASAISSAAMSLAAIGEKERAREWAERAMALEPDNHILRYNIACAFVMELNDHDRALDLIEDSLMHLGVDHVRDAKADPDLASLRSHPRFAKMIEDAKRRLRISNTGD
jgi:adenylate cyclase